LFYYIDKQTDRQAKYINRYLWDYGTKLKNTNKSPFFKNIFAEVPSTSATTAPTTPKNEQYEEVKGIYFKGTDNQFYLR